jgi:hypothetical protein
MEISSSLAQAMAVTGDAIGDGFGFLEQFKSIKHHQTLTPHTRGYNPLAMLAVGKVKDNLLAPVRYYLFEKKPYITAAGTADWQWVRYQDYTDPVKLPAWLAVPAPGYVMPLSTNTDEYDYIGHDGHKNIGTWIDRAAQRAGR